ncbi:hypothetical protein OH720_10965 [Pseudomonas sp. WJP1]|uniref:hypothetical protein n=1 Tax=Pseudomonas sp. WJP1 TaxID=2986947 RepID=UPI00234B0F10|nr:hypothetical protein [Pseudomonas sp. WJP1]WCM53501.1 hypothetical protein OH720_10965 [Pseudomonas sp. WJP1]
MRPSKGFVDNWVKIITVVVAVGGFVFGVLQWQVKEGHDRDQRAEEYNRSEKSRKDEFDKSEKIRQIESTRPFLQRQLDLYIETTQVVARIATKNLADTSKDQARFWELFWGELALVENESVESAMVNMSEAIKDKCPKSYLEQASLRVAHTMRASLDKSWSIHAWVYPDSASSELSDLPKSSGDQAPIKQSKNDKMKCGKVVDESLKDGLPPSSATKN